MTVFPENPMQSARKFLGEASSLIVGNDKDLIIVAHIALVEIDWSYFPYLEQLLAMLSILLNNSRDFRLFDRKS